MEEILETISIVTDIIIIFGAAYIGRLFWLAYKQSGEGRSAALSAIFVVMAAYFAVHLIIHVLGMEETFEWLGSHLAMKLMLMIMIIALSIVLSVKAGWKGSHLKEESENKKVA